MAIVLRRGAGQDLWFGGLSASGGCSSVRSKG